MGKTTKTVQEILAKNPDTKTCTDLKLLLNGQHAIEGKSYHGTLTYEDEDHSTFVEDDEPAPARKTSKKSNKPSGRQWHALAGSLHGKVSTNANGSMLILYARHEDYQTDARQLADLIASEAEQIADALADINMVEEVAKCGK